jgi:hypothetical protein
VSNLEQRLKTPDIGNGRRHCQAGCSCLSLVTTARYSRSTCVLTHS